MFKTFELAGNSNIDFYYINFEFCVCSQQVPLRFPCETVPKPSKEILEESVENTEKYHINSKLI